MHFGHAGATFMHPVFVELDGVNEDGSTEYYKIIQPEFSVHNIIVGRMYTDIGGRLQVENTSNPGFKAEMQFYKRNWSSANAYRVTGVIESPENSKAITVEGRWNK